MLILAVARCPIEGVTVAHPADAPEGGFKLRWRVAVGDLTDTDITSFNVQMSRDGSRTLVGYSSADTKAATILDENGERILTGPVGSTFPTVSAISSDGRILVASIEGGEEKESVLAWYDVDTGRQFQNATLGIGSRVDSLSISDDADLVAVSGVVWSNYTFITALDSKARQLWNQVTKAEEIVGYYEYSYLFSSLAVAGDGSHVAAALRDMTVRFWGVCGGKSGVALFNKQGEQVWNHSAPECVWNVATSGEGRYVAAASSSQLYEFDSEGKLLWSRPFISGTVCISDTGGRFVAGDYDGRLFLGNEGGPYWEREVHGQIESIAISDSGDISAAVVSRSYSDAPTVHLLYILNDEGRLLGNYSYTGPTQVTGASRVAISGNGCCIVAALETDGIYYFERSETETETAAIPTSTSTHATGEIGNMQIAATVLLVGASGFVALLFVIIAKSRAKSNDGSRRAA
jgi:hypothetical protein